jgi:acetoacetyl-CoA reductase
MDKQVALVTGGTGGIGTAICQALSKLGNKVVAGYNNGQDPSRAKTWQQQQRQAGVEAEICYGDVSNFESCQAMIAEITQQWGPVTILVNNAGITQDATLKKMAVEQWQAVLRINLDSVFNVSRCVLEGMLEQGFGRIINISSINGQKGQFGQTNYSASKAGIHGFTMALAQEVASKGITVNTLSPGYVATEMVKKMPTEVLNKIIANIPLGRLAEPEEIARLVAFLTEKQSGFITGANLAINGGQHMC